VVLSLLVNPFSGRQLLKIALRHWLLRHRSALARLDQARRAARALGRRYARRRSAGAALTQRFPITPGNSYQARACLTRAADGGDEVRIAYIDNDTTRVTENGGVLE
jgi:hypothetical protein